MSYATPPTGLGSETGESLGNFDDIDDFNGQSFVLLSGGSADYKYDFNISTGVYYIADDFDYNTSTGVMGTVQISTSDANKMTNIKMVRVTFNSKEGNITLYAFSSNIGEYKILHE